MINHHRTHAKIHVQLITSALIGAFLFSMTAPSYAQSAANQRYRQKSGMDSIIVRSAAPSARPHPMKSHDSSIRAYLKNLKQLKASNAGDPAFTQNLDEMADLVKNRLFFTGPYEKTAVSHGLWALSFKKI